MEQRTIIEDLPAEGEVLSEDQLRLVNGGQRHCGGHSHTAWVDGPTDTDDPF